jgi:hypothetical protein
MLLPILVFEYGPKQAVPIMAIAALMSNIARVTAWWREVNWLSASAICPSFVKKDRFDRTTLDLSFEHVDRSRHAH